MNPFGNNVGPAPPYLYPYANTNPNVYGYSSVPQPQRSSIPGRTVQNESEIKPNEVSMDGSVSLFPTTDLSCIYAKQWTANGTIVTAKYILQAETNAKKPIDDPVLERLDRIEKLLTPKRNRKDELNVEA